MKVMRTTVATVVAATLSMSAFSVFAEASLTGAGATFPAPVYAKWADTYQKETGNKVNYQGIGSSGGVKQIIANTVDFGASDAPLSDEKLAQEGLFQFRFENARQEWQPPPVFLSALQYILKKWRRQKGYLHHRNQ